MKSLQYVKHTIILDLIKVITPYDNVVISWSMVCLHLW